jgi:hypothetical protein
MRSYPNLGWTADRRIQPKSSVVQLKVTAIEVHRLVGRPQQPQDREALLKPTDGLPDRHTEPCLFGRLAGTDSEEDPAGREVLEGQGRLRQLGRMSSEHFGDARSKLDLLGNLCRRRHRSDRVEENVR